MDIAVQHRLMTLAEEYLARARGGHQIDHTRRVVDYTRMLAAAYPACDAEALEAAAWLHDIGRGVKHQKKESHAAVSARVAYPLLKKLGFDKERARRIREAIADHSFSAGRVPASLEGRLLQDADRLDALGAIGIARTFADGRSRELYALDDPAGKERPLDDEEYALDHFFSKLLTLWETLHTPEARALAARRTAFMHAFVEEMLYEIRQEPEDAPSASSRVSE